jgi:hypothetical protein
MKHRHRIIAGTVLIAVIGIGGIASRASKSRSENQAFEKSTSPTTPVLASTPAAPSPLPSANIDILTRHELLGSLNHQPIKFYGKVVDQFDVPVTRAEVRAEVIYNTGESSGVTRRTLLTDSRGNFALTGVSGRTLDFNIVKTGYDFIPQRDAYDYTAIVPEHKRHHPDPNNPVVLHMWKLQGAESLIGKHASTKLMSDGREYRFDLVNGTVVPSGGDLIIRLYHDQQKAGIQVGPYDWKAEVTVVDGGLKEENQRIAHMYSAPAEGYLEHIAIDMLARSPDWNRVYTRNFYVKVRRNLYCRLNIDLHTIPVGNGSYIDLSWWLNPKPGSRNLESPAVILQEFQKRPGGTAVVAVCGGGHPLYLGVLWRDILQVGCPNLVFSIRTPLERNAIRIERRVSYEGRLLGEGSRR